MARELGNHQGQIGFLLFKEPILVVGEYTVNIKYQNQTAVVPLIVKEKGK